MNIAEDEGFIRNVESLIVPEQVSDIIFFSSFRKMLPSHLFKKLLYRTSKRFPHLGFVIEPYCLFLFYRINDTAKAQSLLPDRYSLARAEIFAGDEAEYFFGMGIFSTRASTFWGNRLESYVVAKDTVTGITSWIFLDILSNTIIANPRKGITGPNCRNAMYTTSSKGEVFLDFIQDKTNRRLSLKGALTRGKMRPLEQDLWIMGNASVGHGRSFAGNDDEPFAVIFDPAEVAAALDIPPGDLQVAINTILPDFADPEIRKAVCFPYAQHYMADSPGHRTFVKDPQDMVVKYNGIAELKNMRTFSAKAVKIQFLIGAAVTALASAVLLILLLLK